MRRFVIILLMAISLIAAAVRGSQLLQEEGHHPFLANHTTLHIPPALNATLAPVANASAAALAKGAGRLLRFRVG